MEIRHDPEPRNEALTNALKQACSRNKALEKKQLWDERERQDRGSKSQLSLRSRDGGVVRNVTVVPRGAFVTANSVNHYEAHRSRNKEGKEDCQLSRFCDGKDSAWRPDSFFMEACDSNEAPPWPVRPHELFTNPALIKRAKEQMEAKGKERTEKKKNKKEQKKAAKHAKKSKKPKDKKTSKGKKRKKEESKKVKAGDNKKKKAKKCKRVLEDASSGDSASSAAEPAPDVAADTDESDLGSPAAVDSNSGEDSCSNGSSS